MESSSQSLNTHSILCGSPILWLFLIKCVLIYDAANEAAITRLGGTYIGYELMEDYTSGKGRQNNISLQEGWHGLHFV